MSYPHDRPAQEPGGMECCECGAIFVGAEWHDQCAVCVNNGWRPIDTAPEDEDILTYTPRENHRIGIICGLHVGCFRTDLMVWHLSDDEWELSPTHWQPLPKPPVQP